MEILERADDETTVSSPRGYVVGNRMSVWVGSSGVSAQLENILAFSASELVEQSDQIWTVRDIESGIFGTGPDYEAAVADFEAALREHLDVLERQLALSEELEAQREYLRRRLS